jgi:hypothetical protein
MLSDDALIYRFPYGHADRERRGELNPAFLHPALMQERVCAALDALDGTLETVMLRLQPVYRTEELRAPEFVGRLDRFLGGLPRAYRYAVDLRTPAFNVPEYRACLHDHGVAHVLHHTPLPAPHGVPHLLLQPPEPPPLIDQVLIPGILSAPFCVAHVHTGQTSDYDDDDETLTLGIHELVRACGDEGVVLTVLLDEGPAGDGADHGHRIGSYATRPVRDREHRDHGDGSGGPAVPALARLLYALNGELARRSPLRRRAA